MDGSMAFFCVSSCERRGEMAIRPFTPFPPPQQRALCQKSNAAHFSQFCTSRNALEPELAIGSNYTRISPRGSRGRTKRKKRPNRPR